MTVMLSAKVLTVLTGEDGLLVIIQRGHSSGTLGMTRGNGDEMDSEIETEAMRMSACCGNVVQRVQLM